MPGGWVGGDAWSGSIESCIELKKWCNVYSTFIIKQNVNYFPMQVLHKVLLARHGFKPAGHWVVMQITIADVKTCLVTKRGGLHDSLVQHHCYE